ncbi:D-alanyl-D-alanine carboxypeptidase family protein [Alkaliphilus sp. B6464]|uniref:D-alanyl-D-alanine carboxypeptidase family protein n=1 Tax=Alkaliphilus sp. B6464 TaxID=2731219 RepID=UPI001BA880D9|nr:D-alanyl-D-alanine carboxypeptidase family protein [Alkaliphilus sp. B6464]QUH20514.1 D-alanyl-D-alanine carboxypeptidase [Alkaliphilus sp. B6464]
MKYKWRYLLIFTLVAFIVTSISNITFAQEAPAITAPNGVLIDYETGKILFDKNAHQQAYPASTTKVMTAVLVLENANLDDRVTIDYDLYVDGSSMYLLRGESFTVKELLHALLIRSANDTAEALAIHVAGSVEKFVEMMNQRAKELGALNTNFSNPHGLPDTSHVTTAYDLAMIAKHAMSFDLFREIVNTPMLTFEPTEQTPETRYYRNTNKFLWGTGAGNQMLYNGKYINIKYDIIDGIKTGYTGAAKQCLISSGVKEDHRVISVILGAEGVDVYSDSRTLIDYGHTNFKLVSLTGNNSDQLKVPVKNGKDNYVNIAIANDKLSIIPNNTNLSNITESISINEDIKAPITQGKVLGKLSYSLDNEVIGEIDLIAKESIEEQPILLRLLKPSKFFVIFISAFVLWQIFIAYLRIKKRNRKRFSYKKRSPIYSFNKNIFK